MIAHAGGWDELLVLLALGLLVFFVMRRAGKKAPPEQEDPGAADRACQYCGQALQQEDARCPRCGFKVEERPGLK
ncbi:MAG: hypothetical protein ACRDGU_01060 [Actinomycetota bacterium]